VYIFNKIPVRVSTPPVSKKKNCSGRGVALDKKRIK
jgi:hypothetical protein